MAVKSEKIISIDECDINSGRVMEMTQRTTVVPNTFISVPSNHHAIVIVEGEPIKVVRSCVKKRLDKLLGSERMGKRTSVLYVSNRAFTAMSWGIGSLPITYKFLGDESVNVGANGTLIPTITDEYAFFKSFGRSEGALGLTECVSAITSAFRKSASKILVELFNEAIQPIFDTDFLISEFNRRISKRLCNRELESSLPGVVFKSADVTSIRVNEEDKKAIIEKYGTKRKV